MQTSIVLAAPVEEEELTYFRLGRMESVAVILFWLIGLGVMLKLSAWVLGPLEKSAKSHSQRLQFTLGDWICLILMFQVWAATVHSFVAMIGAGTDGAVFADAYGWALVVILWIGAVWRLTSAGIRNVWHRAAALILVYPLTVVGSIIVPGLLAVIIANSFASPNGGLPAVVPIACIVGIVSILAAMAWASRFVRTIVNSREFEPIDTKMVERLSSSGEDSHRHESPDPNQGQDDCEQE